MLTALAHLLPKHFQVLREPPWARQEVHRGKEAAGIPAAGPHSSPTCPRFIQKHNDFISLPKTTNVATRSYITGAGNSTKFTPRINRTLASRV